MRTDRPQIKVPYQTIDVIVELASITLLILMCVYPISQYASLPDSIPIHFNSKGEADDFGHKSFIFFIPAVSVGLYVFLFIINKYPHLHNYMVNITEENALKNYRFSTKTLRILNFLCVVLMAYITYVIIQNAKGIKMDLGTWFLPVVIGFSILLPIILIVYMKQLNK